MIESRRENCQGIDGLPFRLAARAGVPASNSCLTTHKAKVNLKFTVGMRNLNPREFETVI